MTPKEKLQKKIQDKRNEVFRLQDQVEIATTELATLGRVMDELFGGEAVAEKRKGGRPSDAVWKAEQEKLLKVLDRDDPLTVRDIARKLYGDEWNETIRGRITQRITRCIEKGTVERVAPGRFRVKRGPSLVAT